METTCPDLDEGEGGQGNDLDITCRDMDMTCRQMVREQKEEHLSQYSSVCPGDTSTGV